MGSCDKKNDTMTETNSPTKVHEEEEKPKYILHYFNAKGQGEFIRWMFQCAGVEFKDMRIDPWNWWRPKAHKSRAPFMQCPWLEIQLPNGEIVKMCQRIAIAAYLGREYGFGGKTSLEQARVQMIALCCDDTRKPVENIRFSIDEEQKKIDIKEYEEILPKFLEKLEKFLKENNEGKGFFVGDDITYADMVFTCLIDWMTQGVCGINPQIENYPLLVGLMERVKSYPQINKWLTRRPETKI